MKKLLALILASIMVMSFVTGCGGTKSDSGAANTGKDSSTQQKTEEKQLRVGVSYSNISSQFDSACSNDIVEAGTARGYDVLLTNAESDTQKQITDVEDLISRSCDVILIQPIDKEAVAPAIDACKKAGVPAIVLHRPVLNRSAPDDFVMSMTSDGVYQGQLCCQWAIDNLEGPFKVVELMGPTAVQEALDRGSGFDNLAESNGGFEFVAKQNADWDRVLARNAMENIIQATGGDFNLVYTHNEEIIPVDKNVSYFYLNKLAADYIPYWDFDFTDGSGAARDSSIAAITSCGFLEMYKYLPDDAEQKKVFKNAADAQINALIDKCENHGDDADGLILQVTHALPQGQGIEECAVYGDYFYMETLMRYLNPDWKRYW